MQNDDKLIFVGFISSCFGIKGDVVIKSYTANSEDICNYSLMTSENVQVELKFIRKNSNGNLICKLNNIIDRNEAEKWLKKKLFCFRSELASTEEDEFYIEDLKNLKLINEEGSEIGIISDICDFGAETIVEIKLISGMKLMLPFNKDFFPLINHDYAVCIVNENNY